MELPWLKAAFDFVTSESGFAIMTAVSACAGYLYRHIRRVYKRLKENYSIPHLVDVDIQVYTQLSDLLLTTGAVRVFVFQFHNGVYYVNSANQMKMSCTHEVVRDGFSKEGKDMQDILLSEFPESIKKIVNQDYVIFDVNGPDPTCFCEVLKNQGVKLAILSKMTYKDNIDGFVGISFWEDQETDWVETGKDGVCLIVKEHASRIAYILRGKK